MKNHEKTLEKIPPIHPAQPLHVPRGGPRDLRRKGRAAAVLRAGRAEGPGAALASVGTVGISWVI